MVSKPSLSPDLAIAFFTSARLRAIASRTLIEGVLGIFSDTAREFTFVLVGGLALAGESLGVVGVFALRDTADPVFRTVVRELGVLVMELSTRGRVGVVGAGVILVLDGLREG